MEIKPSEKSRGLWKPVDIAKSRAGNIVIADCANRRIAEYDNEGRFIQDFDLNPYLKGWIQRIRVDVNDMLYVLSKEMDGQVIIRFENNLFKRKEENLVGMELYEFQLHLMENKNNNLKITIESAEKIITDINGVQWDKQEIILKQGTEMPYETTLLIHWKGSDPNCKIIIQDTDGNTHLQYIKGNKVKSE